MGGDLGRRAFGVDGATDHHDDVAGKAEHDMHVVFDEQQRQVARQARNRLEYVGALVLRHAGGWLVEQQNLRPGRQR